MPFTPIPWARQSVLGRQVEADGSRLVNFYAVRAVMPDEAKVPVLIYSTPGYRAWAEVPPKTFDQGGRDITPPAGVYGLVEKNSPIYGNKLYGVSAGYQFFEIEWDADFDPARKRNPDAVHVVAAGDIHNFTEELSERATGPVHMVTDGRYILWTGNREVFLWDSAANGGAGQFVVPVAPIPDAEPGPLAPQDWVDCEWVDGYFILAAKNGQFFHSQLLLAEALEDADTAIQFDQLDAAFASADPDEIVGIRAFARVVYVFGAQTIESWFNAGLADFAFRRNNSVITELGCAAKGSIQGNEAGIFFVASNKSVYRVAGGLTKMSTESVDYDLARADIRDCTAFVYTEEGHQFYSLTIPLQFADVDGSTVKNWTLDTTTGLWHERTMTGVYAAAKYRGRNYFGFGDSGKVYELSLDWGDHDRMAVARRAQAPVIYANQQRIRIFAFTADLSQRAQHDIESNDDHMYLEWLNENTPPWQPVEKAMTRREFGLSRQRWNRLSTTSTSQSFALVANATRRVDLLGAYVLADIDPWGTV